MYYIDVESQVVGSLWRHLDREERKDGFDDDDQDSDGDESDEAGDDEQAQKLAMEMMLSGQHPDSEIDTLLESFGVQLSQIGLIPIGFATEDDDDSRLNQEEIRELIDDIRYVYKHW